MTSSPRKTGKQTRPSRRVMRDLLKPVGLDAAERIVLPPVMGSREAADVREQLLTRRGRIIDLDGSRVERLGALGLQVLLSAQATWRGDGQRLRVVEPSEPFRSGLALLGADFLIQPTP